MSAQGRKEETEKNLKEKKAHMNAYKTGKSPNDLLPINATGSVY